ncbi:alpha/beta fold hydrolase [Streptomyces filamentosus]
MVLTRAGGRLRRIAGEEFFVGPGGGHLTRPGDELRVAHPIGPCDRDLSTPLRWARDLAAATPRAELVVLPGAGHSTQSRSEGGARAAEEFLLR